MTPPKTGDNHLVRNESRLRVRYAETDQMGVVYHSNHFVWFEIGRVELLRQLGFSYRDMEQNDDCFIAVVDARCRYRAPARYDDELIVLVRVGDGLLLADGETTHIVTNAKMQIVALPEKYMKVFRATIGRDII